jgi:hypothetical protein
MHQKCEQIKTKQVNLIVVWLVHFNICTQDLHCVGYCCFNSAQLKVKKISYNIYNRLTRLYLIKFVFFFMNFNNYKFYFFMGLYEKIGEFKNKHDRYERIFEGFEF